jgi:hypothetical protein
MAGVLTTGSSITCAHKATGTPAGEAKLTVSGAKVLTKAGVPNWSFAPSCTQKPTNAEPNKVPCTTMARQSGGESKKLTVGGSPVVLESITGTTNGKPVDSVSASADQTKLTAA